MVSEKSVLSEGGLSAFKSRCEMVRGMNFTAKSNDLYGLTAGMLDWRWRNVRFHNIGKLIHLLNYCRQSIALIFVLRKKSYISRK